MSLTQDDLVRLANNPERGINQIINEIENAWFDKKVLINSKSHPFVFASDLIIGTTYGVLNRIDDSLSKLFPVHARTVSDLSRHMSEEERFGMFGTPSTSTLQFAIAEDSYQAIAKPITITQGRSTFTYKLLLLPKDTEITFNGYTFAIENGVEIRHSERTGYQVVYDDETNNPYNPISNSILERDFREVNGTKYLSINIPVRQLHCKVVENITSNEASGCRGTITFNDNLYGVRAFLVRNNRLSEIKVTYDQDVFDPATPTLALDLDTANNLFNYEIPDVYIANGLGVGILRIYTYTTKGELIKDFTGVELSGVEVNYQDYRYGAGRLNEYSAPLKTTGGVAWRAIDITTGGSNASPFHVIKQSFIQGRRQRALPITENNLIGTVENYGYKTVKSIDYLTKRSYALTKELPIQENKNFYAPMSCFVGSHLASASELVSSAVVIDNGLRVTIPRNVLFDITNPTAQLVNKLTRDTYLSMNGELISDLHKNRTLAYTPFYYVLDMTEYQAVLRTYHLDDPKINYQTFVAENTALGLEVGPGSVQIEHQEDGYLITVVTKSGKSYRDLDNEAVGLQLSIQPEDTNSYASIKADFVGLSDEGERIFQIKLASRFDVDVNGVIYFNNFTQFGEVQLATGSYLNTKFSLIFTFAGDRENTSTPSDEKIDDTLFDVPMVSVIETEYSVTLGKELKNLYSRIRPIVGGAQYRKYEQDVPAVYTTTVYQRDEEGKIVFQDGAPVILHRTGDAMVTDAGFPVYQYRAGDTMYDENGQPIELAPRDLKYHWDFIAFDAAYFFSKDAYDIQFAQDTKNFFINVIGKDLEAFETQALDQTKLVYQPRSKLGYQKVVVNSNFQTFLKQDLKFTVTFYLTSSGYKNQNLKTALSNSTPKLINEALFNATTISMSELTALIKNDASTQEIVAIKIGALSGNTTLDVITNIDDLSGFSIRKSLRLGSDGLLTIEEDVDIVFLPHDISMVNTN